MVIRIMGSKKMRDRIGGAIKINILSRALTLSKARSCSRWLGRA
jgi:hypothetical protein